MGTSNAVGAAASVRYRARWGGLVLLVVLLLGSAVIAGAGVPAYRVGPGEAISLATTLRVDGDAIDEVVDGDFLITTIGLEDATVADMVRSWLDAGVTVVPRSAFLPAGVAEEEFVDGQRTAFQRSLATASAVTERLAGGGRPALRVDDDRVGGPSAGLIVALAAIDVRSPADLAAARRVAATGEITEDGMVVSVGSVGLKVETAVVAGASILLVPADAAREARAAVPPTASLQIVGVETVADAVDALAS